MHAPFQPQLRSELDTEYFPTDEIDQTDHTAAWENQARQISEEHDTDMTLPFIGYTFKRFGGNDDF
jgi:protein-serine/threonine kinase